MGAEPLSRHAMPSRGRCEMGHSPCGYSQPPPKLFFFLHFEASGFHFEQVLANLAFCFSSLKKGICCLKR